MSIPNLINTYLNDNDLKQYEIAQEINKKMGFSYITPMAISYWKNGIHPPTIKTAMTIRQAAAEGSPLWILFDNIIKVLEDGQPMQA